VGFAHRENRLLIPGSASGGASESYGPSLGPMELEARLAGPLTVTLRSDDRAAMEWLVEFLHPWFEPCARAGEKEVSVSSAEDAYAELSDRQPNDVTFRACFAFDQQVVSMPAWPTDEGVAVADLRRSCFLVVGRRRIALFGDPKTRRWRFTLQLVLHEIAAARARRAHLDLHAAAIEADGRGVAIVGPKRAGKTTLSFHLLRSRRCRWIGNDRAFVGRDDTGTFTIRGMPTAVKIQPEMLVDFPELRRGLRSVERPYLHALAEVVGAGAGDELDGSVEFALSPPQLARQLDVKPLASAPLAAIVFPQIRPESRGFTVERLEKAEASRAVWANLYGKRSRRLEPTLFEEVEGGASGPSRSRADALSRVVPAYRVVLGRDAYAAGDFPSRLLEAVLP
jgi:hypothetical protein